MRSAPTAVFLVLLALLVTGCSSSPASPSTVLSGTKAFVRIPGGPMGPARGEVTDTDGSKWSYADVPKGTVTLLYFGYTSCPDVCPTTMSDLAEALRHVPKQVSHRVTVRFVSTDPARDTASQIRGWLGGFDPAFIGARAPIGQVVRAAATYGIGIEPPKVTKDDYQVTHGAQVLVLQPAGGDVGYFRAGTPWRTYARVLPAIVSAYALAGAGRG